MTAWAQAGMARAAGLLAVRARPFEVTQDRRTESTVRGRRRGRRPSSAAHEIAMRLCVSRRAAQGVIDCGLAFDAAMMPVGDSLSAGEIDLARARAFVDALSDSPAPTAIDVVEAVLPSAPRRTAAQVTRDIAAALVAVDPAEASCRHRRARERRRVDRPTPLPDGMASLYAVMPAVDLVALDLALDAAARTARAAGDRRTSDQLRADALASVGHHALATGWIGAPPDPLGERGFEGTSGGTRGAFRLGRIGGVEPRINVTVPLTVLLGQDGPPDPSVGVHGAQRVPPVAALDGYGPISPDVARALALGGTWQRLVTDPRSGVVLDVGRRRYTPPPELARLVRARDRFCVRPGCGARAQSCDLDHTVPFHLGGPTALANLGPLCPGDHALKSQGVYRVEQPEPGVFEFHLPSGHSYRRELDASTTMLRRRGSFRPEPDRSMSEDRRRLATAGSGDGGGRTRRPRVPHRRSGARTAHEDPPF
jgi:hypothetical protein